MKKCRIIERTWPDGNLTYTIQQRHFLFCWMWVDASLNSWDYANEVDTYPTLPSALANIYRFDGTPDNFERIVFDNSERR